MTDVAALPNFAQEPFESGFPPVRPRWLGPAATTAAILAHMALGVLFMNFALEKIVPLDSVSADLIPEGDQFESVEQVEMDDVPPPEEMEQPDFAIPPPLVMHPEAPPLPAKKEIVEPQKNKVVQKRQEVARAEHKQHAQERHRLGMEGGQAASGGLSRASYAALLAASIRRHVPSSSTLGPGTASCSFHVSPGGGMSGIGCSGSSPAHAALLHTAIASVRAPPPPGGGFFASQAVHFH
jgi:periplasmic protein TonB